MPIDEDLRKEIDAMNQFQPTTDPPGDQSTDPPGTESPSTEAPGTDAPGTEAPETEAPTTAPPDERDDAQKYRDELERTLREKAEGKKETKEEKPPATKAPTTEAPFDPDADVDFIGDEDLDRVTSDKVALNAILNRVYKAGVGAGTKLGSEKVLRSIPEIVKKNITAQSSLQKARDTFYESNKDLVPYPTVVAEAFNEAASESPELSMGDLLKETEKKARARLNLHRKTMIDQTTSNRKKPKFERTPSGPGKKGKEKELSGLAKELDDMQNIED